MWYRGLSRKEAPQDIRKCRKQIELLVDGRYLRSMLEIYREIARIIEEGQRAAVATIIGTSGSTPGKETSKMLVRDDGSILGTVGGGCTENDVRRMALQVIVTEVPVRHKFRLTAATAAETGLLCGGEFEVFIEPVGNPVVYIFGAGHIAAHLVPHLKNLDYKTVVLDDRDTYCNKERFPLATEVHVRDFHKAFEGFKFGPNSYVLIVTRGHEHDETVLEQAVTTAAPYIGLIGSRGKIGAIFKNLRKRGTSDEDLSRVRAPVGYDIGSQSVEEIVISIAAEMIAFRRGCAPQPRSPLHRAKGRPVAGASSSAGEG